MTTQEEYKIPELSLPVETEEVIDLKYETLEKISDHIAKISDIIKEQDIEKTKNDDEIEELKNKLSKNLGHLKISLTMNFWGNREMTKFANIVSKYE